MMNVYSVYDEKAEAYLPPFYQKTDGLAVRAFVGACGQADHDFALHPGDYTLYRLAVFDDSSGVFENGRRELMTGRDAVHKLREDRE